MALCVLALGASASAVGARSWYDSRQDSARRAFEQAVSDTTTNLAIGLNHNSDLVDTVRAFVVAQPQLTNAEFRRWFSLVGRSDYSDAVAFGYSQLVPAADLKAFIARALADPIDPSSSRSSTVFPPGNRPDYCLGRLGVWELPVALPATLDMCATPQGAILRLAGSSGKTLAGSTGETAQQLVNKLWLLLPGHVRAPVLRGSLATDTMLLLFGPVYRNGPEIPATTAARNRLLVGWTVSVFDATQLLRTSLGNRGGLQVQLSHVNLGAKPFVVAQLGNNSTGPLLHAAVTVNGTWRVRFSASARAGGISPFRQAAGILGGGLALSLLVFFLVLALTRSRTRALKLVDERTKDLQHLALHDPLTGLPNRLLIYDRTELMLAASPKTRRLGGRSVHRPR